jgi:hypothetical protein
MDKFHLLLPAVIINEHLMEALRRLRRNSSETNVDRRLITNVLLSFLTTPRADQKRFEMLQLLASVLSWTDTEREKAGLQRAQPTSAATSFWGRPSNVGSPQKSNPDLEKTDETEVCLTSLLCFVDAAHSSSSVVVFSIMGRVPSYRSERRRR